MPNFNVADLVTGNQEEVARQMRICNACRYCEGLCAVFPAMEQRRTFGGDDVDYLSNLCHNCGACYYACQYAPPHEFAINVPTSMAKLRDEAYGRYAWPKALGRVFTHNELWVSLAVVIAIAAFLIGLAAWHTGALFATYQGPGAFYRLMPHNLMIVVFGIVFVYAIVAISMSVRRFWQATGTVSELSRESIWQAMRHTASLRYFDGGGEGCMNDSERPARNRKLYHHATFYGFILCFASTCLGTLFHYAGSEAPYPLWHPVALLGMVGGVGLLIGPAGLLLERVRRDVPIRSTEGFDLGGIFILMLFLTSLSGLALMTFRATPAMGVLLAIHLGIVLALFASLPYGKFVHGAYRFAALVRHAHEQRISKGA